MKSLHGSAIRNTRPPRRLPRYATSSRLPNSCRPRWMHQKYQCDPKWNYTALLTAKYYFRPPAASFAVGRPGNRGSVSRSPRDQVFLDQRFGQTGHRAAVHAAGRGWWGHAYLPGRGINERTAYEPSGIPPKMIQQTQRMRMVVRPEQTSGPGATGVASQPRLICKVQT